MIEYWMKVEEAGKMRKEARITADK